MRFWTCSPVATRTGETSRRMRAWPRMSSGLVGSSIHHGSYALSRLVAAIASLTPQTWFASIINLRSGPSAARISAARRSSSAASSPTFIFTWPKPASIASCTSAATFSSSYPSHPAEVVYAGYPSRRSSASRSARPPTAPPKQVECLVRSERVVDVAKVDARDELFRAQVGQQLPERQAATLRAEIPDRVHDRGRGEVDDALLRAEPAQLAVADDAAPEAAQVGLDSLHRPTDDERRQRPGGGDADLRAPADREGEPVPLEPVVLVGAQDDVRRGVVRIRVHRVRAVERARGREPDVAGLQRDDGRHLGDSDRVIDWAPT